jgi:esterase/lipase superfamily enzyme
MDKRPQVIEHNYEEPKRSQIRQLLEGVGYVRAAEVQWDDWYVHASLAGSSRLATALDAVRIWWAAQHTAHHAGGAAAATAVQQGAVAQNTGVAATAIA